jgi:hypothetical protein
MSANSPMQVPNPYVQMAWVTPPRHAQDLAIKLYAEAGAVAVRRIVFLIFKKYCVEYDLVEL